MKQVIPLETRVITALANHERLLQQVGQMKKQIGAHLAECPVMKKANDWNISAHDSKDLYDEKMRVKTHLWGGVQRNGRKRLRKPHPHG